MTLDQTQAVDQAKLNELLGRFVNDFGATGFAATVVIGDKLRLYRPWPPAQRRRPSWPTAPAPTPGT